MGCEDGWHLHIACMLCHSLPCQYFMRCERLVCHVSYLHTAEALVRTNQSVEITVSGGHLQAMFIITGQEHIVRLGFPFFKLFQVQELSSEWPARWSLKLMLFSSQMSNSYTTVSFLTHSLPKQANRQVCRRAILPKPAICQAAYISVLKSHYRWRTM